MRSLTLVSVLLLLTACARSPVTISIDEAKLATLADSPNVLSQVFSFSPAHAALTRKQLLDLNMFLQQAAAVGAAKKEDVVLAKDSQLFAAIDASLSGAEDWRRLNEEFGASQALPVSRVAAVVDKFAR